MVLFFTFISNGAAQALVQSKQTSLASQHVAAPHSNTLIIGSEQDFPPFATGMTDETAGGFTVDLWKAVATEESLNYTIRVRPFRQILQEFKEGKIDVLINLAQSEERKRFADFTVPHVVVHGAIFVRKGETTIHSEADFSGKSIIVLNADLGHDYAVAQGWEKQLVLVDTAAEGFKLLASGKHDAMLLSKLAGMQTLQSLGISNIQPLASKAGFAQKFAFAVREGRSDLLEKLNEGMALTKANGKYNALYEQWFGMYEVREIQLRDVLKYLSPFVLIVAIAAGYLYYRRQKELRKIQENEALLNFALEGAGDTVWDWDVLTGSVTLSGNGAAMFGYAPSEASRNIADWYALLPQDEQKRWQEMLRNFFHSKAEKFSLEYRVRHKTGDYIWVLTRGIVLERSADGRVARMAGVHTDITERKQAEAELELFRLMVEKTGDAIFMIDDDDGCRMIYVNEAAIKHYGAPREEILTWRIPDWDPNFSYENLAQHVEEVKKLKHLTIESHHRIKSGLIVPVEITLNYLNYQGRHCHFGYFRNISERKLMESQIQHLAHYDSLTNLPNRTLFADRLQQALSVAKRDKTSLAMMYIDLDKFKPINDTLGHNVGDLVLKEVALRIQSCLRESDTVARVGGDEFVVLLPVVDSEPNAFSVAEKIRCALNLPISVAGESLEISSSIGVAIYPEHGSDEISLMKNADAAMYHAKNTGRNTIRIFSPKMSAV